MTGFLPPWWKVSKSYARHHFSDLDHQKLWVVLVLVIPFFMEWLLVEILIAAFYFFKEAVVSILDSPKTLKASFFTLVLGVLFVYPFAGKYLNLSAYYSMMTDYPVSGPDPLACLSEYKIHRYATDSYHVQKLENILNNMGFMDSVKKIDEYIQAKASGSPVTGEMVLNSATKNSVDVRLMLALMQNDSNFGTTGKGARTFNPGNIGNDDTGRVVNYHSWEAGVEAVAKWLKKNRTILVNQKKPVKQASFFKIFI